tara:strand:+ start:1694 stop:2023 length:330 start_codon:yes stop_codon:yes gene_type:complete
MNGRHPRLIFFSLCASLLPLPAAATEILGCASDDRFAVTPSDKLRCEGRNGELSSTLLDLYAAGWRLIDTEFYDKDRQVFYLENEAAPTTDWAVSEPLADAPASTTEEE